MLWLTTAAVCLVLLLIVVAVPVGALIIGPALLVFVVLVIVLFSIAMLIPFQQPQSQSQRFAAEKIMCVFNKIIRKLTGTENA